MAPLKKGEKKKGRSAINEVVTREYTINIHKRIHGMWVHLTPEILNFSSVHCVLETSHRVADVCVFLWLRDM